MPSQHRSFTEFRVLGKRLRVLAIIDPVRQRAQSILDVKHASSAKEAYFSTVLYKDTAEYSGIMPDAVFIGAPPAFRGTMISGRDVEIVASKIFPTSALFVEKPVSSAHPSLVHPLISYFRERGRFVAVGYMSRYLKGKHLHLL
jgi:predicted dehydrogenase